MTSTLLAFGAVMLVVIIGFAMALHVLFHDLDNFGETQLRLFTAMAGDTEIFDEFSGERLDTVAIILVVVYLFIVTTMLLNLLIAILSTAHAQVQGNVGVEFKVSKARIVACYRMVVDKDLLPIPFNLVQLLGSLVAFLFSHGSLCRPHRLKVFARSASGAETPDENKMMVLEGKDGRNHTKAQGEVSGPKEGKMWQQAQTGTKGQDQRA